MRQAPTVGIVVTISLQHTPKEASVTGHGNLLYEAGLQQAAGNPSRLERLYSCNDPLLKSSSRDLSRDHARADRKY